MTIDPSIMKEVGEAAQKGALQIVPPSNILVIEEVRSETCLRFVHEVFVGKQPRDHKAWAYIVAKHEAIRVVRFHRIHIPLPPTEIAAPSNTERDHDIGSAEALRGVIRILNVAKASLTNALKNEQNKIIIQMHYGQGKKFAEIGLAMGISEDVVKKRSGRIMKKMHQDIWKAIRGDETLSKIFKTIVQSQRTLPVPSWAC